MTITANTKVSVGLAMVLGGAVFARDLWVRETVYDLKRTVEQTFTIEDAQNWTDDFRKTNPQIQVPNPQDVVRKRRTVQVHPSFEPRKREGAEI